MFNAIRTHREGFWESDERERRPAVGDVRHALSRIILVKHAGD